MENNQKNLNILKRNKKKLTTPFKVKIKKCRVNFHHVIEIIGYSKNQFSKDKYEIQKIVGSCYTWYADKIGEEFEVLNCLPKELGCYRVNNDAGCGFYFIDIDDCEIVNN